jgi:hypothetical protein
MDDRMISLVLVLVVVMSGVNSVVVLVAVGDSGVPGHITVTVDPATLFSELQQSEKRIPSLKGLSHLELKEEKDYFLLIDEDSYTSEGITSENPVCHVYVGNLETSLEWTTGHAHKVEEIQCRARGDPADVFRIWKERSTGQ